MSPSMRKASGFKRRPQDACKRWCKLAGILGRKGRFTRVNLSAMTRTAGGQTGKP